MVHRYTDEQVEFIKENVPGRSRKEMLELFNRQFGTELTLTQIVSFMKRHNLKNGLSGQFQKGQVPFNKGMKGVDFSGENGKKTQFQKGHKPHNYLPVGTERVNGDDYVDIKIADPNKWRAKHLLVWEAANGPVPKGHAVIFGDGDRRNFDLNNLILVSRKQLSVLNKHNLIQRDADLTRTGIIVADIYSKLSERKKESKGR